MSTTLARKLESLVERIVMGGRWLQAPLYKIVSDQKAAGH